MAHEVLLPKLSSTMETGSITQWFKNEGDSVEIGEAIFEVMTDKIAIEVEAYEEGVLLKKYYGIDEDIPINSVIGYIGEANESVPDTPPSSEVVVEEDPTSVSEKSVTSAVSASQTVLVAKETVGQIRATPAARKLAREKGISLSSIQGSGRNGRIHVSDVQVIKSPQQDIQFEGNQITVIPWKGMRKAVADSMVRSKTTIPHVTMNAQVDFSAVIALRKQLLPQIEEITSKRISYLEIIMKAVSVALKQFPRLNAQALEDGIHEHSQINLGMAVAIDDGLVVPVIKGTNSLGLADLTVAVKDATEKARSGQLTREDMTGGTFTISSLGLGKVRHFNPVINAPEVAILGVSSMFDGVYKGNLGEVEIRPSLTLSLSFDHRAIDGAPVSEFLTVLVDLLEQPYSLLI